jgi:hypothetical protein
LKSSSGQVRQHDGAAATAPRITWAELSLGAAVRYGTGELKLAVFLGPDCPQYRKLGPELRARPRRWRKGLLA